MIASAGPLVSVASVLSRSIRGCDLLGLLVDEGVPVRRTLHEGIANLRVGGQPEGVVDDASATCSPTTSGSRNSN